jgi:hypothetical protein
VSQEPKTRSAEYLDLEAVDLASAGNGQLTKLLKLLHKKRKIVVVAGAGISVSAGSTLLHHSSISIYAFLVPLTLSQFPTSDRLQVYSSH